MDMRSVAVATDRLRASFEGRLPNETIEATLRESIDALAKDAKVDKYVPLLAERRTRERLTALARR
jgi:hypothetical protein